MVAARRKTPERRSKAYVEGLKVRARFAGGGLRMRRIGIVALARRLLIALWRYLEQGVIPQGARLIVSEI